MDAFLLKKLISVFVRLVPGLFLFVLLCLLLRRWWPRAANAMIVLSLLVLIGLSSPPLSNWLVNTLESRYPVLLSAPEDTTLILVLANARKWANEQPPNTFMRATSLSRITEGVRLWKTKPDAVLATSSDKIDSSVAQIPTMLSFATAQGVLPGQTVQLAGPRDTKEEIEAAINHMKHTLSNDLPGDKQRLLVVSSAVHLARAELILQEHEVLYSVAPSNFTVSPGPWYRLSGFYLESANRAVHEYIGIVWLHLHKVFNRN